MPSNSQQQENSPEGMVSQPRDEVERLRAFAWRLITRHDTLRASHARQLFDSVAQQLAAVQFELAAANQQLIECGVEPALTKPREIVSQVLEEVRHLSATLHPGTLDRRGLPLAIRKLARILAENHGVEIEVAIEDPCKMLSPAAATILYACAEEVLESALTRPTTSPIRVTLRFWEGEKAQLSVSSKGLTADVELISTGNSTRKAHLLSMLELIGGTLRICSDGEGETTMFVEVPCSP